MKFESNKKEFQIQVLMMTFNHEKFIGRAIESVIEQETSFSFQLVISVDKSEDNTLEICKNYQKKFPDKIKILESDSNIGSQKNAVKILNYANAKYIAICEGDDYWIDKFKLQKQVEFLELNKDYSLCFHYTQEIYENGVNGKIYGKNGRRIDFNVSDTFSPIAIFHTSSIVFRRSAFQLTDWFSLVVSADMALFSIVSAKGKLRCIPEIMSVYRKHEGGLTRTKAVIDNYHKNRIQLMNYLNEFHQFKYDKEAKKVIAFHQRAIEGIPEKVDLLTLLKQKIRKIIYK